MRIISIDTETLGLGGAPWSIQYSMRPGHGGLVFAHDHGGLSKLGRVLASPRVLTVVHNTLFDLKVMSKMGIRPHRVLDTMIMAYLLGESSLKLKVLAYRYAHMEMRTYMDVVRPYSEKMARPWLEQVMEHEWADSEPVIEENPDGTVHVRQPQNLSKRLNRFLNKYDAGTAKQGLVEYWTDKKMEADREMVEPVFGEIPIATLADVPIEEAVNYSVMDADATGRIFPPLMEQIVHMGLENVLERDMAILPMVLEMMKNGMLIDQDHFARLSKELEIESDKLQIEINKVAGAYLNASSPLQVLEALHKRGLQIKSTNAVELDKHRDDELVRLIQDYRGTVKLRSTYVDVLPRVTDEHGRVHTNLSVTRAITGRLASCLPAHTTITTLIGNILLREIKVGDYVWTHKHRWRPVLSMVDNGIQPVFNIKLDNEYNIDCTSNHRLLTNHLWLSLEDIYECEQKTFVRPTNFAKCSGCLQRTRPTNNRRYCKKVRRILVNSKFYNQARCIKRRVPARKSSTVVSRKEIKQPHDGKIQGITPQLQRGNFGRKRLSVDSTPRLVYRKNKQQTCFLPSGSFMQSSRLDRDTGWVRGASHKWGQNRQPDRESCISVACWTQASTPSFSYIREIKYVGIIRVFDVEVEEDSSFVANGIFVHNSKPNLQNQPVRSETGRKIRGGFMAGEGKLLLAMDLSQIELRYSAHESQDPTLVEAYWTGKDIHTETAMAMFGIERDKVESYLHRRPAKVTNFGIIYGITPAGLLMRFYHEDITEFTEEDCAQFIEAWKNKYPGYFDWADETKAFAIRHGYVVDMFGRRRWVPEVYSVNSRIREGGLREAVNAPIQSGAQGYIKESMRRLCPRIMEWRYSGGILLPLLQVHDELIFEVQEELVDAVVGEFTPVIENAVELIVPVKVGVKVGKRWGSMKEYKEPQNE